MMLLLFQIEGERYGMDVNAVTEVIPRVPLQRLPRMPQGMAGLLNYRGEVVPVLDMSLMLHQRPSRPFLSTRIIVAKMPGASNRYVGLMAEDVAETIKVRAEDFSKTGMEGDAEAFVDSVVLEGNRMIQKVDPAKLLTDEVRSFLIHASELVE